MSDVRRSLYLVLTCRNPVGGNNNPLPRTRVPGVVGDLHTANVAFLHPVRTRFRDRTPCPAKPSTPLAFLGNWSITRATVHVLRLLVVSGIAAYYERVMRFIGTPVPPAHLVMNV